MGTIRVLRSPRSDGSGLCTDERPHRAPGVPGPPFPSYARSITSLSDANRSSHALQGLCAYILEQEPKAKEMGVVIGHVRHRKRQLDQLD